MQIIDPESKPCVRLFLVCNLQNSPYMIEFYLYVFARIIKAIMMFAYLVINIHGIVIMIYKANHATLQFTLFPIEMSLLNAVTA